jgi:dTMP kinase
MKHEGKFITFEGGEGAGKTTLIDAVYASLHERGFPVLKTRAPGGSKVGEAIREILLHKQDLAIGKRCELMLFLADRAQHVEEVIMPALKKGIAVLCDRFNDSTVAYQGGARGFGEEKVRGLCAFASSNLEPDLTLYLDIDPKQGLERRKKGGFTDDRIESEAIAFHQKIRDSFHKIAREEPQRVHIIDASPASDLVFKKSMILIDRLIS